MDALHRLVPWAVRGAWAVQPLVAGPALSTALDGRSPGARAAAAGLLWAGWAVALAASAWLAPLALTAVRVLVPAAVPATAWAAATGEPSVAAGAAAVAGTAAAALLVLAPAVGRAFVNGPAYGDERRHLLRPPGPLLLGPLELAWAVVVAAPAAVALLVGARAWAPAAAVAVVGLPTAVVAARSLHGLAARWLVLVPAGVVLKDGLAVVDPVLVRREVVEALRPAPAASDSLDLTQGSLGLALELLLREKVPMVLVKAAERAGEAGSSARFLVSPTRPGQVLDDAAARRLPVG